MLEHQIDKPIVADGEPASPPQHFASMTTRGEGVRRYNVYFRPDGKQQGIYSVVMAEDYDALVDSKQEV